MQPRRLTRIAGIGASAGGVEALSELFRAMPPQLDLAFVVVTHAARGRPSALADILARCTTAPVAYATDGVAVENGSIYVASPDHVVQVVEGRIRLTERQDGALRTPIDVLLGSLATDQGERAIGILLSGGGSDGTLGLKAVRQAGGLTIAQGTDGTAPAHHSMPDSAIAAGVVDLVIPSEQIGERLGEILAREAALTEAQAEPRGMEVVQRILQAQVGHDFSGYKDRTFERRVRRRMQLLGLSDLDAYVARLQGDAAQVQLLFQDLLIGVTTFFRDSEAFDTLARLVLPRLFERSGGGETVRVWVPGCATGEEAYSIAMLLLEHAATLDAAPKVQVFATDIQEAGLAIARLGRYPAPLLAGVSPERRERFFVGDDLSYAVRKEVRDACVFSTHSVIRDPPFSRIDLISCRNLLIYFDQVEQAHVVPVFHFALKPGGFLFLGTSENVSRHGDLFLALDRKARIFQRRDHAVMASALPARPRGESPAPRRQVGRPGGAEATSLRRLAEARVLDRFAPAHVVVTRDGDVVHFSSRTGKYLEAAAGQPSRQILSMARRGLRPDLLVALRTAAETRSLVVRPPSPVEVDDRVQMVSLRCEPLADESAEPLFLVVFEDVGPTSVPHEGASAAPGDDASLRLEQELRETRERLQGVIEEYETAVEELKSSNEELQSMNEELQSTNEELETSKEEMQSINEELQTLNAELHQKVEEVDRANTDLRNVFEATQVATVFLDERLVIRSFTPAATSIFRLIPSDRGRPLSDIVPQVEPVVDLKRDIEQVFQGRAPVERPVRRLDGSASYLMQILPYRSDGTRVTGALVIFIEVTELIKAEAHQRTLVEELNHRVRNMLTIVSAIAVQTLSRSESLDDFAGSFLGRMHALGHAYGLVAREGWGDVEIASIVTTVLRPHAEAWKGRVSVTGPRLALRPSAAVAFGLVVHELATNAAKYGAFATPVGWVEIAWRADGERVRLEWTEHGGPPVASNVRRGFGTQLIERQVASALDGAIELRFETFGLQAILTIPRDGRIVVPVELETEA